MYGHNDMRRASYPRNNLTATSWLIFINISVFILQEISHIWFRSTFIETFFALSRYSMGSGYVWTLVTYAFLHGSVLHVLVNMLAIFFVGRILEFSLGWKNLLKIYFVSLIFGGLFWLVLGRGHADILVGASAAGFGLMTFFCLLYPDKPITVLLFFIIPLTLKPKWILWGMLAMEGFLYLFFETSGKSVIASSGHLGGIIGGAMMYQWMIKWKHLFNFGKIKGPKWLKKIRNPKVANPRFTISIANKETIKNEVDRVLDKINKKGFGSLTDEERRILDKANDILR